MRMIMTCPLHPNQSVGERSRGLQVYFQVRRIGLELWPGLALHPASGRARFAVSTWHQPTSQLELHKHKLRNVFDDQHDPAPKTWRVDHPPALVDG